MAKTKSLIRIIGNDFLRRSKLTILLFIGVIITTLMTILTTNETRILRHEQEKNTVVKRSLDIEMRNLILEENTLGEQKRIESIATQGLKMEHIVPENERILMIPPRP
ncbi:cell division protein FtsL [Thorsellia anophelis]|uniref:Cell division protein FtsL n=1 Tax=Thorsellia anophelis DSM 18579 TaxID=1123402 RepID=A0A1H9ZC40_9GAMM|nr:cell division protein FtsL [Thorsellia anophelis]SES79189.1 cell division protein FtsL [Thorsellia anophelis DSM 18579]